MPPTLFILFLCVEIWASMLKYKTIRAFFFDRIYGIPRLTFSITVRS